MPQKWIKFKLIKKKQSSNKTGKMAECELRQRKKEDNDGDTLREDNDEAISHVKQNPVQTENKSESVRIIH